MVVGLLAGCEGLASLWGPPAAQAVQGGFWEGTSLYVAVSWLLPLTSTVSPPFLLLCRLAGASQRGLPCPPCQVALAAPPHAITSSFLFLAVCLPCPIPTQLEHEPQPGRPCLAYFYTPGA